MNVYDRIAPYYHLLFDDWDHATEAEGNRIDAILRSGNTRRVLDFTCGTGLQCIGLSRLGYAVTGCDPSAGMLRQARQNARTAGARVRWLMTPAKDLPPGLGPFDAALSCGNSLSHLLEEDDLALTLKRVHDLLRPGGACLVDAWDYTSMLGSRPSGTYRRSGKDGRGRKFFFYDARRYEGGLVVSEYNLLVEMARGWKAFRFSMELRPWSKEELERGLRHAGLRLKQDMSVGETVQLLSVKED